MTVKDLLFKDLQIAPNAATHENLNGLTWHWHGVVDERLVDPVHLLLWRCIHDEIANAVGEMMP